MALAWYYMIAFFIAGVYLVFLTVWVALLFAFRLKHKISLTLLALSVFTLLLLGSSAWESRPSAIFRRTFGFEPTPDVEIVRSSEDEGPDWLLVNLRFKANPDTIQRITRRGLHRIRPGSAGLSGPKPSWWNPRWPPEQFYQGTFNGRHFANEKEDLVYDHGTAYFTLDAIE